MPTNYPLVQQGTAPACFGTPTELFTQIAQSFVVPVSISGIILSQDEPGVDERGNLWGRFNANGSLDAVYFYWTGGPSGANWYKKDPYWIGQIAQFDSGPPSTRWKICDGTNGTINYGGRVLGASGQDSGLTLRTNNQKVGEETHLLTSAEVPQTPIANIGGALVSGAGPGPNNTIAAPSSPGADLTAIARVNGGNGAHNNMQPTIFIATYRYVGPVFTIPGA